MYFFHQFLGQTGCFKICNLRYIRELFVKIYNNRWHLKYVEDIIHFKCTYGNMVHTAWTVEVYL